MIYIRRLEMVDDMGQVVMKIQNKRAVEGLTNAFAILKAKDSPKEIGKIKQYLTKIDSEFKEYFGYE